jgi:hypothetical protein
MLLAYSRAASNPHAAGTEDPVVHQFSLNTVLHVKLKSSITGVGLLNVAFAPCLETISLASALTSL